MKEIKITINEEDGGRVALNVEWGDWNDGTWKERILCASLHDPMIELFKNLPVGTLAGYAEADTPEEAQHKCELMADIFEIGIKEETDDGQS